MHAIAKVTRIRETADKTSSETAYYLLSQPLAAERFNSVARAHWGVENRLQLLRVSREPFEVLLIRQHRDSLCAEKLVVAQLYGDEIIPQNVAIAVPQDRARM